jgi:hypothetical protein
MDENRTIPRHIVTFSKNNGKKQIIEGDTDSERIENTFQRQV